MEGLALMLFGNAYAGKRVLVTGHTGFKGSWLCLFLKRLGAEVYGYSLAPEDSPNHISLLGNIVDETYADVRDAHSLREICQHCQPDIIFHLAAQSLVRKSYDDPVDTWTSNLNGTLSVMEALRHNPAIQCAVIVTTDKIYQNVESEQGYAESHNLGGHDPYSASKAACELLVQSYNQSFFKAQGQRVSTVRAGNVIGGGDWARDRLIPDIVRSSLAGQPLLIRSPDAIRPWQHVLDCLAGYLLVGQTLIQKNSQCRSTWNIGPVDEDCVSVATILKKMHEIWPALTWRVEKDERKHETTRLKLDITQVKQRLGWQPVWRFDEALACTLAWYKAFYRTTEVISASQLDVFIQTAQSKQAVWTTN